MHADYEVFPDRACGLNDLAIPEPRRSGALSIVGHKPANHHRLAVAAKCAGMRKWTLRCQLLKEMISRPPGASGDCNAVPVSRIERIANAVSSSNGGRTNGGDNGVWQSAASRPSPTRLLETAPEDEEASGTTRCRTSVRRRGQDPSALKRPGSRPLDAPALAISGRPRVHLRPGHRDGACAGSSSPPRSDRRWRRRPVQLPLGRSCGRPAAR